jgi:hypothetical protein
MTQTLAIEAPAAPSISLPATSGRWIVAPDAGNFTVGDCVKAPLNCQYCDSCHI